MESRNILTYVDSPNFHYRCYCSGEIMFLLAADAIGYSYEKKKKNLDAYLTFYTTKEKNKLGTAKIKYSSKISLSGYTQAMDGGKIFTNHI